MAFAESILTILCLICFLQVFQLYGRAILNRQSAPIFASANAKHYTSIENKNTVTVKRFDKMCTGAVTEKVPVTASFTFRHSEILQTDLLR